MQLELMFILNMSADVLSRVEPLKFPSKEPEGAEIFGYRGLTQRKALGRLQGNFKGELEGRLQENKSQAEISLTEDALEAPI